ncbi:PREDICTED: ATP synthase F(0) complex subunit C1, mitochondrial [Ficedula albicollis]|uniref:ATP synthase F(0) complex subunit C1, mitochondrial n=1 Tax=Ficedula albicollis TaxID=59894 RepID=UPI0007AD7DA6|nr:PREDICTED: ATP synthase F(0) complex subunit C1, mitochondrial [Ficedula albicollis]
MQAPVALLGSPALFRCCSRALARPVSMAVFSRPEAQTAQVRLGMGFGVILVLIPDPPSCSLTLARLGHYPLILFPGLGHYSLILSLILSHSRNPSLKQQLFSYAILGFALSEAMGLFCLMVAFLILFAM